MLVGSRRFPERLRQLGFDSADREGGDYYGYCAGARVGAK